MCGIAGFLSFDPARTPPRERLEAANECLAKRGPDGAGVLYDPAKGLGLAHRRLSIVDLSDQAAQPMTAPNGTQLVFNGEIYGFSKLRSECERQGWRFRSHSDSEVLLAMHSLGMADVASRLNGMFAYACFDPKRRRLLLARDRSGEKPLVIRVWKETLYFASTVSALRALCPEADWSPDVESIRWFLRFDSIPRGRSVWKDVLRIEPGQSAAWENGSLQIGRYWEIGKQSSHPTLPPDLSEDDLVRRFDSLLEKVVSETLVADVPVGIFLSGGIDSTLVARTASRLVKDLHTFSIGFEDASHDESIFANEAARLIGSDHHHHRLAVSEIAASAQEAWAALDEPLGDSSYLACWHLARWARRSVTVALGGDGADEVFWGYVSMPFERFGALLSAPSMQIPPSVTSFLRNLYRPRGYLPLFHKALQFAEGMGHATDLRHQLWISASVPRGLRGVFDRTSSAPRERREEPRAAEQRWWEMGRFYFENFLPGSVLTKSDRSSMAHSLEVRSPFLHPEMIEFALALPHREKVRGFETKRVLRRSLERDPRLSGFARRKKHGFAIPVADVLSHRALAEPLGRSFDRASPWIAETLLLPDTGAFFREQLTQQRFAHPKFTYNLAVLANWLEREVL